MNKILIVFALLAILGCRTKSKIVETEKLGAKVERVTQVEAKVEKRALKDSVIQKKKTEEIKDETTNIKVEFDPKKDDSLEVNYQLGTDSLRLKINGNGKVTFDFKTIKKQVVSEMKEIFGSETLYNIDSTLKSESKEETKIETKKTAKKVEEKSFPFGIYLIIGGAVLFAVLLFFLWKKFGGGLIDRFKNGKIRF